MGRRFVTTSLAGLAAAQNLATFDDLPATSSPGYREIGAYGKLEWENMWAIDLTADNASRIAPASAPNGVAFRFPDTTNAVERGPSAPRFFGMESFSFACVDAIPNGRPIPCSVLCIGWQFGRATVGSSGVFDPPADADNATAVPMAYKLLHPSRFTGMERFTFEGVYVDTSVEGPPDPDRTVEGWVILDNVRFKDLE